MVVTRPENRPLLEQNSRIVLLERSLCELSTAGRPLSQQQSVLELARAALLALMERKRPSSVFLAEEGLWNRYQGWLLLAALAAAVGLTVLMLGKRADTKREI